MKENSIRRAVREGRAALGTGIKEFATRGMPWIVESSGFDYAMIDMEHGAFDLESIANLAGWFEATNVSPIVRIHKAFINLIPVILGDPVRCRQAANLLLEHHGIYVQPIDYPTVPRGTERFRITTSPLHTDADEQALVAGLADVWERLELPRVGELPVPTSA